MTSKSESFAALFESERRVPRRGRVEVGRELDVRIAQIGKGSVFVDLDEKRQGYIETKELVDAEGNLTVKVGSSLRARVVAVDDGTGTVQLLPLVVRADEEKAEDAIAPGAVAAGALVVGAHVKGAVVGIERYGLFVQIAGTGPRPTRGLAPVSELGVPRGADLHKAFPIGTEIDAKIVAVDERGRIKLSIAALAADEERKAYTSFQGDQAKPKGGGEARSPRSFGTLGDLLVGVKPAAAPSAGAKAKPSGQRSEAGGGAGIRRR